MKKLFIMFSLMMALGLLFGSSKKEANENKASDDTLLSQSSESTSKLKNNGGQSKKDGTNELFSPSSRTPKNSEETQLNGNNNSQNTNRADSGTSLLKQGWEMAKGIFYFGIILLILFLLVKIFKKFNSGGLTSDNFIDVVTTKQLSGTRYLHVVRIGNEYILMSATDGGVNLIKTIEDKETVDSLQVYKEKNALPSQRNFRDILHALIRPDSKKVSQEQKTFESINKLKKQSDRLKNM